MANIIGTKWGSSELGTPGGTVTWSLAAAGTDISRFGVETKVSTTGETFLNYDFVQSIENAFAEWSKHGDIEFQQVPDQGGPAGVGTEADIRIFFGAIPGGTAGFAFFPSSWGSAIAGDILLDTLSRFNTDRVLFENLLLHEIGHALGLGHTTGESIMTPTIRKIGLQQDDIDGIIAIYGAQDDVIVPPAPDPVPEPEPEPQPEPQDPPQDEPTQQDPPQQDPPQQEPPQDEPTQQDPPQQDPPQEEPSEQDPHDHDDDHNHTHGDDESALPTLPGNGLNNRIEGTDAAERILGEGGNDTLLGLGEDDQILGGTGHDLIFGGAGDDSLWGNDDNDLIKGEGGNDLISGDAGRDKVFGGGGNDIVLGGSGNDTVRGGSGSDELEGGAGKDILKGGTGSDIFIFADGHGNDIVNDFNALSSAEKLDLRGVSGITDFSDVAAAATQTGGDVRIVTSADSSILLRNVDLAQLDAGDFLF